MTTTNEPRTNEPRIYYELYFVSAYLSFAHAVHDVHSDHRGEYNDWHSFVARRSVLCAGTVGAERHQ